VVEAPVVEAPVVEAPVVPEPVVDAVVPEPVVEPSIVVEPDVVAEKTKTKSKSKSNEATVKPSKGKRDKRPSVEVDLSLLDEAHEQEGREFAAGARADKAAAAASAVAASAVAASVPEFEAGFIETSSETSDEWFAANTPAWDEQLDEEHLHASERKNKRTLYIALAVFGVLVLAFMAWVQFASVEEDPEFTKTAAVVVSDTTPAFDIVGHVQVFDVALTDGRLIAPFGNCALSTLENVKREAPASSEFEAMRKSFVDRTDRDASLADEAGDLNLARTLAGYASQWAPDDQQLKARAAEMQARYVGTLVVPGADDVGSVSDVGAEGDAAMMAAPEEPVIPEPIEEKIEEKVEKTEKTEPKVVKVVETPSPEKEAPTADKKALLVDARAAYARGDVSRAQKLYEELAKIDGGNHIVQAGLGQAYFDQANYDDAVRHQLQAVKLRPGRTEYRINLGQSYYRLSRYKEAIAAWEEVLRIEPANANAKQYIELAKRKLN
jgi:hypothetical protein